MTAPPAASGGGARPAADGADAFSAALLAWYDRERRDLPWRREPDPYRTLVSEVMLQQTVVATVVPHFERFVAHFPDVRSLAAAREGDVLALWSGLGYYARARHLHRAARLVVTGHGGRVPADEDALRGLPGVGAYTAAALAAIAFGRRTLGVDGNAARVLARLFGVRGSAAEAGPRRALGRRALALVPADRPGDFQQAVMELGARICIARAPRCPSCPVAAHCRARALGVAARIPGRRPAIRRRPLALSVAIVRRRAGTLLGLRRPGELFAGTWLAPVEEIADRRDGTSAARRAVRRLGLVPGTPAPLGSVEHVLTHRHIHARVFAVPARGRPRGPRGTLGFVPAARLPTLGLSSFARKILRLVDAREARLA